MACLQYSNHSWLALPSTIDFSNVVISKVKNLQLKMSMYFFTWKTQAEVDSGDNLTVASWHTFYCPLQLFGFCSLTLSMFLRFFVMLGSSK
jgi:hypothetical protein